MLLEYEKGDMVNKKDIKKKVSKNAKFRWETFIFATNPQ